MINQINKPIFRICSDTLFKEVFTKVPNALINLVNDCLDIDYDNNKDNIQIECTSELSKERFNNKTTLCDFVVKVGEYFKINIEVNQNNYKGLTERNLLFLSRLYSIFIPKGLPYEELPKYRVVQFNINRFGNINGNILTRKVLYDLETKKIDTESLYYYNYDIAKCYDVYYNNTKSNIDKNSKIIRWGALLCTEKLSDIANIIGDDLMSAEDKEKLIKVVNMFSEECNSFSKDDIEQMTEYKMAGERLVAREEGHAEGHAEGLAEGHAEGHAEGKLEEKKETIINMLNKNYDIKEISEITNASEEEIIEIKKSL